MNYGFEKWRGYSASQWRNDLTWKVYEIAKKVIKAGHAAWRRAIKLFDSQKRIYLPDLIDKVYIIHLPGRLDRFKKVKKRLKGVKLKGKKTLYDYTEFIDGVIGSSVPKEGNEIITPQYTFEYHWDVDPTPQWNILPNKDNIILECSDAERGVSTAHYNVWKTFLDSGEQSALIMEDDIEFGFGFNRKLEKILEEAPYDWDLIYLSSLPCETGFTWEEHSEHLVRAYNGVWWLSGYMISKRFAKRLINEAPIVGPVDLWINYMFEGANIFVTPTSIIDQAQDTASDNTYSYATQGF